MARDIKNENYLIKNAWKLYIEKGILKRHILRDVVAYSWERSRLTGVKYNQKISDLVETQKNQPDIYFTSNMKQLIKNKHLSAIICTADAVIVDSVITHDQLTSLIANKKIKQSKTGNLSIFTTMSNTAPAYYYGAEHYLECLHFITDYSMPLHIKHNNYILTFFETFDNSHPDKRLKTLEHIKNEWLEIWNNNLLNAPNNAVFKNIDKDKFNSIDSLSFDDKKIFTYKTFQGVCNILITGNQYFEIKNKVKSICLNLDDEFTVITVDFWYVDSSVLNKIIMQQERLGNVAIIFKNIDKLSDSARKNFFNILSRIKKSSDKKILTITMVNDINKIIDHDDLIVFDDVIEFKYQKNAEVIDLYSDASKIYDLSEIEKNVIEKALEETHQNMSKTAKLLNICRSTLYRKIEKYDINLK